MKKGGKIKMTSARLNTKFKIKKEKKKAKRCKKCGKVIREENKSGLCERCGNKKAYKKYKKTLSAINLDKKIYEKFVEYCSENGFVISRKVGIIINDFLKMKQEEKLK